MLDRHLRPLIDRALPGLARALHRRGITAGGLTGAGLLLGLLSAGAVAGGWLGVALVLFLASRLCDGLDGAVARLAPTAPLGGYLDIMADFAVYAALPLGLALHDPAANALPAALLLASFFINSASFLGFAILAEKQGLESRANGEKAHYHATGLIEGSETIAFFTLVMLWPGAFPWLAPLFAALTALSALLRVLRAVRLFGA